MFKIVVLEHVDKIRNANAFISTLWDEQEEHNWTRSMSWQNSDSAWAYREWMETWERRIPAPSLPNCVYAAGLNLDASKILRGVPDEPTE